VFTKNINDMSMLQNVGTYQEFLKKQKEERDTFLEIVSTKIVDGLTDYVKGWGWERKGKSGGLQGDKIKGVKFTKNFNGKNVVIEYRNNLRIDNDGLYYSKGYNEFIHDKSLPNTTEVYQMLFFNWNDDTTSSGWSLDVVLQRMEDFYSKW
jgi:hypothetical protein